MGAHKPVSGSHAYYPRVRAKSQKAVFSTFKPGAKEAKPQNFYGYKAGMVHLAGKNAHDKSVSYGQDIMIPSTVIECPPLKVIGARVYGKTHYGLKVLGETTIDKADRHLRNRVKAFKKKGNRREGHKDAKPGLPKGSPLPSEEHARKEEKKYSVFEDLEKLKDAAAKVVLLCEAQPSLTGIGKKKADIAEVTIGGTQEQQFAYAKEKMGKELRVSEVFALQEFVDVKAVDKGKGFQGVVKRAGVKVHRPKSKRHRYVGSIGPWHPPTVMWTVPRPGQLGYQTRTEYNKRVLMIDSGAAVNPPAGFNGYGTVRNEYIVLKGSVPGPSKRIVTLRHAVRVHDLNLAKYTDIKFSENAKSHSAERAGHAKNRAEVAA